MGGLGKVSCQGTLKSSTNAILSPSNTHWPPSTVSIFLVTTVHGLMPVCALSPALSDPVSVEEQLLTLIDQLSVDTLGIPPPGSTCLLAISLFNFFYFFLRHF